MKKIIFISLLLVSLLINVAFADNKQNSKNFDQYYLDNKFVVTKFISSVEDLEISIFDSTSTEGLKVFFHRIPRLGTVSAVESEFEQYGGFLNKYKVKDINDEYFRIFGVKEDMTQYMPLVTETHNWDSIPFAHNGEYVFLTTWVAGGIGVEYDIKKMVNIGDNFYYLEFDQYASHEHGGRDLPGLVFSEFPNEAKMLYEFHGSGCAIIKKNETNDSGMFSLIYQSYEAKMLPSVEIKEIIEKAKPYYNIFSAPAYSYPKVTKVIPTSDIEMIRNLINSSFNGNITEIYKLAEDKYYVIVQITEGKYSGAVISLANSGENISYSLERSSEEVLTQEELDVYVDEVNKTPNIKIDYARTANLISLSENTSYLLESLSDKYSLVNDAGKSEIIAFIENAITRLSTVPVNQNDNRITIIGESIEKAILAANTAKIAFENTLEDVNIILNKKIDIIIKIDGSNLDIYKPVQITFDQSTIDNLKGANSILILLGDTKHTIKVDAENLKEIFGQYNGLNIQVERISEGVYNITYADGDGKTMDNLSLPIGFSFPTQNELATVFVSYKDGSDNWGGQYNPINQTIEILTKYSGKYEVLSNDIIINDISELSDDSKKAIQFMVSKGYFKLTSDKFNVEGNLTRFDFTEALVRMFFAIDRAVASKFEDVKSENPYFVYVSSAEKDRIVEGFSDNYFRGELNITKEQVIMLCARTLVEQKGYLYPESLEYYLQFDDVDQISEWSKQAIALAVREGLIDGKGALDPKTDIKRLEAAKILYKLFMLLYEPAPFELTMSSSEEDSVPVPTQISENSKDETNFFTPIVIVIFFSALICVVYIYRKNQNVKP